MANYREIAFDIDFTSKKALNNQDIILEELTQNDHNSSILTLRLLQDEQPIDLTGMTVVLNFLLPDGSDHRVDIAQSHNINTRTSLVMYYLPKEILSQVGVVVGTVSLYKAGYRYTSIVQFKFEVVEDIVVDGDIVDSEKYPILVSMINNINMIHEDEAKRVQAEESRVNAELERIEAEEERETAEATRSLSELERQEAEESRMVSEANRELMELERQKAEALRVASISKIESNELSRIEAEELRIQDEESRKSAESSRVEAENVRQSQETVRQQKETERQTAEQSRKDGESQRENNESARVVSESKRVEVELLRVQSESDRSNAELERIEAEELRIQNNEQYTEAETVRSEQEIIRQQNEEDRVSAEEVRVLGESKRISAETERQNSETARVQAEASREAKQNEFNARAEEVALRIEEEVQRIDELVTLKENERVKPTDMVDYMGNQHESLKDKADSDVEYILGEVNTVHYEGQTITATDTIERQVRSAIFKGCTLVNILSSSSIELSSTGTFNKKYSHELTLGDKYLIKLKIKSIAETTSSLPVKFQPFGHLEKDIQYFDISLDDYFVGNEITKVMTVTMNQTGGIEPSFTYRMRDYVSGTFSCEIVMIKYQEGIENWDIPYFTGMQSVRMPVLKTTGKNLFDYKSYTNGDGLVQIENGFRVTSWAYKKPFKNFLKPNTWYQSSYLYNIIRPSVGATDDGGGKLAIGSGSEYILITGIKGANFSFRTPENIEIYYELLFYADGGGGSDVGEVEITNIQIEEGSTATSYEHYKSNILTVNEEVELRGIGDVKDELNLLTGELTERIGKITFDGSENWVTIAQGRYSIKNTLNNIKRPDLSDINFKCDKLKPIPYSQEFNGTLGITSSEKIDYDFIVRTDIKTIEEFKQWLSNNPTTVCYQLKTESVKTVDLNNQKVYSYDGTTHYTCSSEDGSLVPTLSIDVPTNLPALVSRQRATIEELEKENEALKEEVIIVDQQREDGDVELLGYNFDLDFRLLEIECALDLPAVLNTRNIKGANDMNTYKTAKTLILAGNYERDDMEYKLSVYLRRGRLTQDEYDELIALMDARELVE